MLIIDRIHDGIAVCEQEDRSMVEVPLDQLPPGVREGDCLDPQTDGSYAPNEAERDRRRQRNASLFQSLLASDDDEDDDTPDVDDIREDYWE